MFILCICSSPYLDRKDSEVPAEGEYKTKPTVAPLNLQQQQQQFAQQQFSPDSDVPSTSHASTERSCPSNLINGLAEIIVADDVAQAAIHDAFLEVMVSERIPDWTRGASAPSTSAAAATVAQRRTTGGTRISPEKATTPPRANNVVDTMAQNVEAEVLIDQQAPSSSSADEQQSGVVQKATVVEKASSASSKADKLSRHSSSGSESIHAGGSQVCLGGTHYNFVNGDAHISKKCVSYKLLSLQRGNLCPSLFASPLA